MQPADQKHSQFWCLGFTKMQFLEKLSPVDIFAFFFKSIVLWHIYENFQKIHLKIVSKDFKK